MARHASASDFDEGELYNEYRRYPFFAERADLIHQRWPTGKILVVGCGWGYLVDELRRRGRDAWGVDASGWAIARGKELAGNLSAGRTLEGLDRGMRVDVAGRLLVGDATDPVRMETVRAAAGLHGRARFAVAVTEDVLPVLDDAEIPDLLAQVRHAADVVLHCVTPADTDDPDDMARRHSGLNWKKIGAWRTLCAPDPVYDEERRTV